MGRFLTLVVGGLIGAGIMAATAPQTGKETRDQIKGAVNDVKETAVKANEQGGPAAVATELVNMGKNVASDAMSAGQEVAAEATAKVQDVAAEATGSTDADELKRKIDEARARIVERVAENAANAKEAVEGVVVTEVEPVVEAVEDVIAAPEEASTDAPEAPGAPA